ncbi:hypothetical protein D3C73_1297500 [compost metagenome]
MLDPVVPAPVLPARSITPVLSSVMALVASITFISGVNVAVHVIPPSEELRSLNVPFSAVRSSSVKPLTASENVNVTAEVSPIFRIVSVTTMVAAGRTVSIA